MTSPPARQSDLSYLQAEVAAVATQSASTAARLDALDKYLRDSPPPPDMRGVAAEVQSLGAGQNEIRTSVRRLEQAIANDPAKALEIPLLRRDLEQSRALQLAEVQTLKQEVDRVYDWSKWVLGTIALAVVTLGVSNFIRRPSDGGAKAND